MSRKRALQKYNRIRRQEMKLGETSFEQKARFSIPVVILLCILLVFLATILISVPIRRSVNRNVDFRTYGDQFQIYRNNEWQDFLIKGVNLGAGKAGYFPGELAISKREYLRWFYQIGDMNANTIRVYTVLEPAFYDALYEYNIVSSNPLYVFHGIWHDETLVATYNNGFAPDLLAQYKQQITYVIDAMHGKANIEAKQGEASGKYRSDVSPFVIGYIMGIEQDATFVLGTTIPEDLTDLQGIRKDTSTGEHNFQGTYLSTKPGASDYEIWLAYVGDYALRYEFQRYHTTRAMSWVNWLTTDPLTHTSEPEQDEDRVSVNTENIIANDTFTQGLFASYHVYPYYPEFMQLQPEYIQYIDRHGNVNPYEAYLKDLKVFHTVPLLVAEFGIPSSRGMSHRNEVTGFNQGMIHEMDAGKMVSSMFDSIVTTGCAGGMVFSWQDEWFKASWNTMNFDIAERRALWSNYQTAEQGFGLLSFDPGTITTPVQIDGDSSEWENRNVVASKDQLSLSIRSDEKFVYFLIRDTIIDMSKNTYVIGIDSLPNQGNTSFTEKNLSFINPVESCIMMDGYDTSAVYIDAYYDAFYRYYSLENTHVVDRNPSFEVKNSGLFHPVRLLLRYQMTLPLTGELWPTDYYETGALKHGNSNPKSPDFDSLADFNINSKQNVIEVRVPWALLNVADPSSRKVIGDLYANDTFAINATEINGLQVELQKVEVTSEAQRSNTDHNNTEHNNVVSISGSYSWQKWDRPTYHERLKVSYPIVQEAFRTVGFPNTDGGWLRQMMKRLGIGMYGHANSDNSGGFSPEGLASLSYQVVERIIIVLSIILIIMCLSILYIRARHTRATMRTQRYWMRVEADYERMFRAAKEVIPIEGMDKQLGRVLEHKNSKYSMTEYDKRRMSDEFEKTFSRIVEHTKRKTDVENLESRLLEEMYKDELINRDIARLVAFRMHLPEQAFLKMKKSKYYNTIASECRKLGLYRYKDAIPVMFDKLEILSTDIQYQVLMACARMGAPKSFVKGLQQVFDHLLLSDRTLITIIKSYRGDREVLHDAMMNQENGIVTATYFNSLEEAEIQQYSEEIVTYQHSEIIELRIAVINCLGKLEDDRYQEALIEGFQDESWEVRTRTAHVFGRQINQKAVPGLIEVASGEHWWARQSAINSILEYPNAQEILLQIIHKGDAYSYNNIRFALEREERLQLLQVIQDAWQKDHSEVSVNHE